MRYNIVAFFILIITVLSAWIASAEGVATEGVATKSADDLWGEAEGAYREGNFAEAAAAYEAIIAQGKESAELYSSQNRPELAAEELAQVAVMEKYLPKQMSEEEVTAVLKEIIAQTGATGPQDMGKVMGVATKQLAGKAEGRTISTIVKQLLA